MFKRNCPLAHKVAWLAVDTAAGGEGFMAGQGRMGRGGVAEQMSLRDKHMCFPA